ncbi:MAG: outer membrane protein assembly factor BamB [Burkholderiales bacterium]
MKKLIYILLLASVSGCASIHNLFGTNTTIPKLPQIHQAFKPLILWDDDVGSADDSVFVPAVDGGAVFAASRDGKLFRFESLKGRKIWKIDTDHKLSAGVGVGDGLVVVCSDDGEVLAYDESGKSMWNYHVLGELLSVPEIADGVVVVRVGDGRIFGLDEKTGKQLWIYQYANPALAIRSYAGVRISQGAVYAGFAGGKLVSVDLKTGAVNWESTVARPHGTTELERIADVTSLPIVDELQVCAVAYQGRLACFDIGKGELIWSSDVSSYSGMIVDKRNFFVSSDQGDVLSLDSSSGASAWKQSELEGREITAPYVQDSYVVVGDVQGYVHFMRRSDGDLVARIDTDGSPIRFQPVRLNSDMFLVQTKKGHLYAMAVP